MMQSNSTLNSILKSKTKMIGTKIPKLFKPKSKESSKGNNVFSSIDDIKTNFDLDRGDEIHTKVFDIPSPHEGRLRLDDELQPSQYIYIEFIDIHNSFYIGVNAIEFFDECGKIIPYTNIAVNNQDVDHDPNKPVHEAVKAAFPPVGWWTAVGDYQTLLFDLGEVRQVKQVNIVCANASATPKIIKISDGMKLSKEQSLDFHHSCFLQLSGKTKLDPTEVMFRQSAHEKDGTMISCDYIINYLNKHPPAHGYDSFLSEDGTSLFAFYRQGLRAKTYNYYIGREASEAVETANSLTIDDGILVKDCAERAMTLHELRVVRAVIMSNCIKHKWKSSLDGKRIRPDDVNLYDLNTILIKPLTKKRNCAFKELFPSGAAAPAYYVSHWWGEKVLDFIKCCEYHAEMHDLDPYTARYWVCAYANRQHDLGADLGTNPEESSFQKAMKLASGVVLVVDPNVVVTKRIWVDYELYTMAKNHRDIDMVAFYNGNPQLLASKDLNYETPFQKSHRERNFPFEHVSKHALTVELYKGQASQDIDKVRILNTMAGNSTLDDNSILERIEVADENDETYVAEMEKFSTADFTLRGQFAIKAWSVALATEGQSVENFYGYDLSEIVMNDLENKSLILDDLMAMEAMNDTEFGRIIGVVGPEIEVLNINVAGCQNLTDECISMIHLPDSLKRLSLSFGYSESITNNGIIDLAGKIPKQVQVLELDVAPQKLGDGSWLPNRNNDHLIAIASGLPSCLTEFSLTTVLHDEKDGPGILEFIKALPQTLTKFHIRVYNWQNFEGSIAANLAEYLPPNLEEFTFNVSGGQYFEDEDWAKFNAELSKLTNLKEVNISTSDSGLRGYYLQRSLKSLNELKSFVKK